MTQLQSSPDQSIENHQQSTGAQGTHDAEPSTRYVIVEINKNMYGITTGSTVELMNSSDAQITRVSHAPKHIRGVINHRGSIIPAIDSRSLMGFQSHQDSVQEIESLLAAREKDHVDWLLSLKECAISGEPFKKATDPTKCAFGKWYDALCANASELTKITKNNAAAIAIIEQFDEPHKRIHAIATEVLRCSSNGDLDHAKQIIENAWNDDLARMKVLFARLIETIRPLHSSMTIIIEHESKKIGLIVDSVHSVFDCTSSSIEALPESTSNAAILDGLVHQDDGSYILMMNIDSLYERADTD